jgi:hypothetical protein
MAHQQPQYEQRGSHHHHRRQTSVRQQQRPPYHSRYSSNYLLAKSLSCSSARKVCNGNEADYDDNDKDENDENDDEYNYDNEYYAQYKCQLYDQHANFNDINDDENDNNNEDEDSSERSDELFGLKSPIATGASVSVAKTVLLLNNTSSAYDTCSNLSNEVSSSLSCGSGSCKNSDRLSSGNASGGDCSLNDFGSGRRGKHSPASTNHDDSLNDSFSGSELHAGKSLDEQVVPASTTVVAATADESTIGNDLSTTQTALMTAAGVDETSTTNTDVSDPHWDGYTVCSQNFFFLIITVKRAILFFNFSTILFSNLLEFTVLWQCERWQSGRHVVFEREGAEARASLGRAVLRARSHRRNSQQVS